VSVCDGRVTLRKNLPLLLCLIDKNQNSAKGLENSREILGIDKNQIRACAKCLKKHQGANIKGKFGLRRRFSELIKIKMGGNQAGGSRIHRKVQRVERSGKNILPPP
jgi:hypothetical protein